MLDFRRPGTPHADVSAPGPPGRACPPRRATPTTLPAMIYLSGEAEMARGEMKKGRENKKPKQTGGKSTAKSEYQLRRSEVVASPFKNKKT
jgi:hypothetical protein